ncbi:hypothetical protein EC55P2_00071 [Enterococcus phage EC55P2]|nr:hypothetical protein EC55P2_00071 [Enterococcus phage EC55P2]
MTQFNVGDRVRFFQDLSWAFGNESADVPLNSIGTVLGYEGRAYDTTPYVLVEFADDREIVFYENELELVDEEVDLPFNPISGITLTNVLDVSLEANQRLYLSALSGMVTARKQMADLTLDRYLPEAVRDSLEDHLSKQLSEFGEQAEDAVKRMSKILEVE